MSWLRLMEEKIKSEAEVVMPLGREKKRKMRKLIEEMWPAYLIEIFVIILGISITLALEEWKDKSKASELATVYQKNLLADVDVDLASLKQVEQSTMELLSSGDQLLNFIKNPSVNILTSSQVDSDIRSIIGRTKFISSDATFSDLKNSD